MKSILLNVPSTVLNGFKKNLFTLIVPLLLLIVQPFTLFAQQIVCPADIVQNADPGTNSAVVYFDVSETNPNVSYTLTSGSSVSSGQRFAIGTTNVTKSITDINGNPVASCSFNITVVQKQGPVFSNCPGNIAVNSDANSCGAIVSFATPSVTEISTLQKKTFNFTGAPQTFTVPAGVTSINVDVKGAAGGRIYYNNSVYGTPGAGGETQATIAVTPGSVLTINVGGAGQDASATSPGAGGYNGGGNGAATIVDNAIYSASGGGGGASDIRTGKGTVADRIIVAGGGGAAGFSDIGGSGGNPGLNGTGGTTSSTGGTQSQGGTGGTYVLVQGSVSGTDTTFTAGNGTVGLGGNGAAGTPGGGGGAGLYGGGGGAFGSGAGGSSFASGAASGVSYYSGTQNGNGNVTFSYNQPAVVTQTAGITSGSLFPVGATTNTFTATDASGNTATCTFIVTVTDKTAPVVTAPATQTFNSTAGSFTIPAVTATDNCGIASITYTVSGATTRTGTGANASGSFNTGTSVITYTVTDTHGNIQTATTSVVVTNPSNPTITVTIPDGYTVSPGGKPNTIYIGYGPSYLVLNATVTGGKAPYTYNWVKTGSAFPISWFSSALILLPGEYTVTVTDAKGVTGTAKKQVQVVDVRCGNNNDKVEVCKPGKGNKKPTTDCVSQNSVDDLLAKGATLGDCSQTTSSAKLVQESAVAVNVTESVEVAEKVADVVQKKQFSVYPNPTSGAFNVQLSNIKATKAEVVILSQNGVMVLRKSVELTGAYQNLSFDISHFSSGIYLVKVVTEGGIQTAKVLLQH